MSGRMPGPLCQESRPQFLDKGTLCLAASPVPGAVGHRPNELQSLDHALAVLQATAQNFAWRYIHDATARAVYVRRIAEAVAGIRLDVMAGRLSAADGAAFAVESRVVRHRRRRWRPRGAALSLIRC